MLDAELIVEINREITGDGSLISPHLLESAISSFYYYQSKEEQICSVFRGILKNHPFADGNKRTAVTALFILSEEMGLPIDHTDSELFDIVLKTVNSDFDVGEIAHMIFQA